MIVENKKTVNVIYYKLYVIQELETSIRPSVFIVPDHCLLVSFIEHCFSSIFLYKIQTFILLIWPLVEKDKTRCKQSAETGLSSVKCWSRGMWNSGKARRLYSYLLWCYCKLYNLLPQPEDTTETLRTKYYWPSVNLLDKAERSPAFWDHT